jgi:acetyl-CoA/propionyl-CoA carboxylase biotin carboxyl carrier protein
MLHELTPAEAAARIGVTTRSVQRWIASGRLPGRRVGGRWRVAIDALDAFAVESSPSGRPARPIERLFVANRGEIVRRIGRTCARLGIEMIAPRTEGPNALDLLDVEAVVAAARASGADTVHPGFGFLAESAEFAAAVERAGLTWVGPPPEAIEAMGDKGRARRLARSLGVPVVPGYDGPGQTDRTLARAARDVGIPLLVKPAAGGGGKGMRIVRDLAELGEALRAARREAAAAFGDDRLILERLVEGPRHVEVQVLFDRQGHGVHLGERDCSIQRRHQKILEESPSPGIDDALRKTLGEEALRLAGAVGYAGAGTCEFLVDDRGRRFFLEMNTRLQVEHPVTELVTGRDLVADQLRIASGEPLGIEEPVRGSGHAVEVRLYAEDAEAGFLPATGRVELLRWPDGDGIRVDDGIDTGTTVDPRFDPMLAKIVAHGRDRDEALRRLADALDRTTLVGVVTNLRFLRWLVRQAVVRDGQAWIDTLARIWPPDDWADRTRIPAEAWSTAAGLLAGGHPADPWSGGWRLNGPARMLLATDGEQRSAAISTDAPLPAVRAGSVAHVDVGGRSIGFRIASPPDVDRAARTAAAHGAAGGASELVAPMPGSILVIHAETGAEVAAGAPVMSLEAMKMEHVVVAPIGGRLTELGVRPGQQVERGEVLGYIEPSADLGSGEAVG